jgi:hypothetical protein
MRRSTTFAQLARAPRRRRGTPFRDRPLGSLDGGVRSEVVPVRQESFDDQLRRDVAAQRRPLRRKPPEASPIYRPRRQPTMDEAIRSTVANGRAAAHAQREPVVLPVEVVQHLRSAMTGVRW